jgi:N utilization substance protein B
MRMTRRKIRETIFLLLFRIEFHSNEELVEQIDDYFADHPDINEADEQYIREKLGAIITNLPVYDDKIREICDGWRLTRLGKAELTILRLAVYEILEDDDIPVGVAINEAVEIARIYCSEEAPRFVNGVLAKLA